MQDNQTIPHVNWVLTQIGKEKVLNFYMNIYFFLIFCEGYLEILTHNNITWQSESTFHAMDVK